VLAKSTIDSSAFMKTISYSKSLSKRINCLLAEKVNYSDLPNGQGVLLASLSRINLDSDSNFDFTIQRIRNDIKEVDYLNRKKNLTSKSEQALAQLFRPVKSARPVSTLQCFQCSLCKRDFSGESISIHFKLKHRSLSMTRYAKKKLPESESVRAHD
jgi:hypothetical protein